MEVTRRGLLAGAGAAATAAAVPAAAQGGRVVIDGVDRYRVVEPVFEGVRVILNKLGEPLTPAYVQGISGAAFRVAGPCPCAPTCACAMTPADLLRLAGYEVEALDFPEPKKADERPAEVLPRIKAAVREGRPVLVFHAFTWAEWDVVCGYDEARKEFLGRGSYAGLRGYARAPERRLVTCTDICPVGGAILVGKKTGTLDRHTAEVSALREAVRFAHARGEGYPYPGLHCYDVWIATFSNPAPRKPDYGQDGYTSRIYSSSRRSAAVFLREIKPRYPRSATMLARAAGHFERESAHLDALHTTLFARERAPRADDPDALHRLNGEAVLLLTQARDAYASGIADLKRALAGIASTT